MKEESLCHDAKGAVVQSLLVAGLAVANEIGIVGSIFCKKVQLDTICHGSSEAKTNSTYFSISA